MRRQFILFVVIGLTVVALASVALKAVSPARASGATQISGIAYVPGPGECADSQQYQADFANRMTGDLEGCMYVTVESAKCSPSGAYLESGTEFFVSDDGNGTFRTTYKFEGKFQDCSNPANLVGEIHGRCQHPIVDGSGTGIFTGVSGRLDFKDDIGAGNYPYRGQLK